MPKTMKAIVKREPGPGLRMEEAPVPEVGPNDVLIRIRKSAICGTDLHIYEWDDWARGAIRTPLVVGHEFAGEVAATGANVHADFREGDVVSGEGHLVCGLCRNCLAGRRHLCAHTSGVGVDRAGSFAEYLAIPVANVWHGHPKVPIETLAYFDPLGNATHTALSFDLVGEDVLITGAGPIGLMAAAIARHVGARHVVVTDRNEYRLSLARRMGATLAVSAETDLQEVQRELDMREGFDVGMEMSGSPAALQEMVANMVHGGRIALLGILPANAAIDWREVIFRSLCIQGIYGREMFETWYKMTSMLLSGLDVSPVLTHRFPAEDFERGFAVMRSGRCGKVILEWD
ncbi:MAG: L-threonine 3-dehydrogenase [Planctomycetota bacterium]